MQNYDVAFHRADVVPASRCQGTSPEHSCSVQYDFACMISQLCMQRRCLSIYIARVYHPFMVREESGRFRNMLWSVWLYTPYSSGIPCKTISLGLALIIPASQLNELSATLIHICDGLRQSGRAFWSAWQKAGMLCCEDFVHVCCPTQVYCCTYDKRQGSSDSKSPSRAALMRLAHFM